MDSVSQELETKQPQELTPLNFNLQPTNTEQWKFWNHIYKTAYVKAEFAAKVRQKPELAGALVLHELADRFHTSIFKAENPSEVTKAFLSWLTLKDRTVEQAIWSDLSIRKAIMDALLARAEKEAAQSFDQNELKIIRSARELIRLSRLDYLSSFYVGTSSAALPGVEQASARLLSVAKLQERDIARRTGEGAKGGARSDIVFQEGISVTTLFETADVYSDLNSTIYLQTPDKAKSQLAKIEENIKYWQGVLQRPPTHLYAHDDAKDHLVALEDARKVTEQQLKRLEVEPDFSEAAYPVVFGLRDLVIHRKEDNDLHAYRSDHEIPLRKHLIRVYVPMDKIEEIKQRLMMMDVQKVAVYPMEAVRLLRSMDPFFEDERRKVSGTAGLLKRINQ